ncbi:MAG: DUF3043 domain-containing protein [Marmoricola sp.]
MFRRTSDQSASSKNLPVDGEPKGPGAKGRPTPSRREAEAATRERAKAGMDKKAAQKLLRQRRTESNAQMRKGMRSGDERFLPARDKGAVRGFTRNFIDSRVSIAEFLLPLLVVIMVLQYSGNAQLMRFSNALWTTTILLVAVDTIWLIFRLKKALRAKFPDESLKGVTFYAITRVLQLRWLRMPKPKVKVGGAPR